VYNFLGLGHISLGIFFVRVHIIRVVIGLMEKYHLDFRVKVQYFLTHFCLNVIPISYCDNSLTLKHKLYILNI
jgi:hypothetical protein